MDIKEIDYLEVQVNPSLKDEFNQPKENLLKLPGEFPCGINHSIKFPCLDCQTLIFFSFNDRKMFEYIRRADKGHFQNYYQLLNIIGNMFGLMPNLKKDELGNDYVNSFSFNGKYKSIADIAAFKCPNCQDQYMISFAYYEGENEKTPEPDIIYIDKLLRVSESFDELRGMY